MSEQELENIIYNAKKNERKKILKYIKCCIEENKDWYYNRQIDNLKKDLSRIKNSDYFWNEEYQVYLRK